MEEFQWQNRRRFLTYMLGSTAAVAGLSAHAQSQQLAKKNVTKITVLYTNDVHSRIDPFSANDPKFPDQGGFARRAALIKKIKKEENNVLLLDAGDIFQGTPYFNLYKGELEYKLMSMMGYDCVTIGNHDFDLGLENVALQMPHASFSFVCGNYMFNDTPLAEKIKPYKVFVKDGIRIGVFGLGIELDGLVDKKLAGNTQYHNPVIVAKDIAETLKKSEKCDFIICLSHLGYKSDGKKINDQSLASLTSDIDLIIGAHTHTFLESPVIIKNIKGVTVPVTQVGWAGIWLGRYDVYFAKNANLATANASVIPVYKEKLISTN